MCNFNAHSIFFLYPKDLSDFHFSNPHKFSSYTL